MTTSADGRKKGVTDKKKKNVGKMAGMTTNAKTSVDFSSSERVGHHKFSISGYVSNSTPHHKQTINTSLNNNTINGSNTMNATN